MLLKQALDTQQEQEQKQKQEQEQEEQAKEEEKEEVLKSKLLLQLKADIARIEAGQQRT